MTRGWALAHVAGVLTLKFETLVDPYFWDALGVVAAPALDSLAHGLGLVHPEAPTFGHPPLLQPAQLPPPRELPFDAGRTRVV